MKSITIVESLFLHLLPVTIKQCGNWCRAFIWKTCSRTTDKWISNILQLFEYLQYVYQIWFRNTFHHHSFTYKWILWLHYSLWRIICYFYTFSREHIIYTFSFNSIFRHVLHHNSYHWATRIKLWPCCTFNTTHHALSHSSHSLEFIVFYEYWVYEIELCVEFK